ncbi:hypothetical protein SCLCIDRAFT_1168760 [Scleroderma citrinum Foug A]|uniref:non-chaperonin molecular chaperone ATPase n=1 Tax=Scleroderma citrinum Foug A TaxID=1036808 RepID=A0A0C3DTX6_9AGAM|nr:hypothetical protein SCLCIDRAFT_1168760 [Scleroderma citrinum Foug A]
MNSKVTSPVIGIDLGTTNSCVSIMKRQQAWVIENTKGAWTTPSIVAFMNHNECLVGLPAKCQAVINPTNTIFTFKHLIGQKFKDTEVQEDIKHWPFKLAKKTDDRLAVKVDVLMVYQSAEELLSMVLMKMQETVKQYLNKKINHKDAGQIASLEVLQVINEPMVTALAHGLNRTYSLVIAMYDLGGGTFDISILEMQNGVFEVKLMNGDTHLSGEEFVISLVNHILGEFKESGINLSEDRVAIQHICKAAEKVKMVLSLTTQTCLSSPPTQVAPSISI